jgi:hypothetical protein
VQQSEDPQRPVLGDQVEIGHAASEQRVSLTEIVMNAILHTDFEALPAVRGMHVGGVAGQQDPRSR